MTSTARNGPDVLSLEQSTYERVLDATPAAARPARSDAIARFSAATMPTGKEEAWRYVELDFDLAEFGLPEAPGTPSHSPFSLAAEDRVASVSLVDGFVTDATSGNGLTITSLQGAPDLVAGPKGAADVFAAAQAALARDGVRIEAARGHGDGRPVVVDVAATQSESLSLPQIHIEVATGAELAVVVVFHSAEHRMVVSPNIVASVADGGHLRMTTVQAWGSKTRAIGFQRYGLGRDATLRLGEIGLGGALARLDLGIDLDGDGSTSDTTGIYFGDGSQVLDYRVVVNHRGRNTASDVHLRGAVEDDAESIFTGLLKIWPAATNTSTFEQNRNLVLSDGAKAHSVPNLEILCDDVVCGHGSTVGPFESEHLYYLESRGLGRERAERLLLRGFFEEVIGRLPAPQLADAVREAVNAKFVAAQREGRIA